MPGEEVPHHGKAAILFEVVLRPKNIDEARLHGLMSTCVLVQERDCPLQFPSELLRSTPRRTESQALIDSNRNVMQLWKPLSSVPCKTMSWKSAANNLPEVPVQ